MSETYSYKDAVKSGDRTADDVIDALESRIAHLVRMADDKQAQLLEGPIPKLSVFGGLSELPSMLTELSYSSGMSHEKLKIFHRILGLAHSLLTQYTEDMMANRAFIAKLQADITELSEELSEERNS